MQIYPAIDIIGGNAVRLTRGDYASEQVFSHSPLETAQSFMAQGASFLHVVDLDGAREGQLSNAQLIKSITALKGLFVEVGGGVRSLKRIEEYINAGAGRVILGSAAVENFALVTDAVKLFGDKVAVGVDACSGKVAIHGWKEVTNKDAFEFCIKLKESGVRTVIYTDISKDGALSGTNLKEYRRLCALKGLNIIASGGITYLEELDELKAMGAYGAILGKAIYTGALDLKAAIERGGDKNAC